MVKMGKSGERGSASEATSYSAAIFALEVVIGKSECVRDEATPSTCFAADG